MQFISGNMWSVGTSEPAAVWVIPTNGSVNGNGNAVMGAGVAKQASSMHKELPEILGRLIQAWGNHCLLLPHRLVSFPVKHHWNEQADLELLERSAYELALLTSVYRWRPVVLPAVGTGNGGRTWYEVGPILHENLQSDRYLLVANRPLVTREEQLTHPAPTDT
jgi:hypothetical protein